MGAIDARERLMADVMFGAGAVVLNTITYAPATWYLALSTTQPNEDGTGFTEPVGGSYARPALTNNATNFPPSTTVNGVTTKKNGAAFTFPNPSGLWGLIGWYGFFDVASGGLVQWHNPLDTPITVQSGNTPVEFAAGQLIMPWD